MHGPACPSTKSCPSGTEAQLNYTILLLAVPRLVLDKPTEYPYPIEGHPYRKVISKKKTISYKVDVRRPLFGKAPPLVS